MKIAIISDTHDNIENTEKAIEIFKQKKVSSIIHCGDFCAPFMMIILDRAEIPIDCVFGNIDEILRLVKETGCSFCLDLAHMLAISKGKMEYKGMFNKVKRFKKLHCHFSGIEWGEKGERRHKKTPLSEIKKMVKAIPKNKNVIIINESADPIGDTIKTIKIRS